MPILTFRLAVYRYCDAITVASEVERRQRAQWLGSEGFLQGYERPFHDRLTAHVVKDDRIDDAEIAKVLGYFSECANAVRLPRELGVGVTEAKAFLITFLGSVPFKEAERFWKSNPEIWRKYGHCPPWTTYEERMRIISGMADPSQSPPPDLNQQPVPS